MEPTPAKPWQHGYDLDYLLTLESRYTSYNARTLGPFAQFKKNRIAERLHKGELQLGKDWSYVMTRAKVRTALTLFPNVVFGERQMGDRTLTHLAANWSDPDWLEEWAQLLRQPAPLWVQVWADDVESIRQLAIVGRRVGTKVTTFGEVFAWFLICSESESRYRVRAVDPEHLYGICPVQVGVQPHVDALASEVAALSLSYQNHYSNYNKQDAWAALSIRGYSPDVTMIAKPSEMNDKWQEKHAGERFFLQDTTLRAALPALERVLAQFPEGTEWHRIRLMRLAPGGGELQRHTDQVDVDSGFGVGQLLRVHIPLKTNPDVRFTVWNEQGAPREVHMPYGQPWVLDTRWPHMAVNGGTEERIHLVMDAVTTPALQKMLVMPESV